MLVVPSFILSGCDQVEEILTKVNLLLDEQLNQKDEVEGVEATHESDGAEEDETENDGVNSNSYGLELGIPFDDLLLRQGYQFYDLPNGYPFDVPYHWIMVDDAADGLQGTFCFELPLDSEDIPHVFGEFNQINYEHEAGESGEIGTTTIAMDSEFESISGTITYFTDDHENTCAKMDVTYGFEGFSEEDGYYGEDPSTMVSEEELAMYEQQENDEANFDFEERKRKLINNYDELVDELKYMDFASVNQMSIRERIRTKDVTLLHLSSGYAKIFPYEWFLLEENDNPMGAAWSGTFCTDTPINHAIDKHLDMLSVYNADIPSISLADEADIGGVSSVQFALNDDYGTGSWRGNSTFYQSGEGIYESHHCIDVEMEFSDQLLD